LSQGHIRNSNSRSGSFRIRFGMPHHSREWYPKRRANRQRRLSNASKDDLSQAPAHGELRWSFEKFLISRGGKVMARFASDLTVDQNVLVKAIERELEVPMKPRRKTAPLGHFLPPPALLASAS
jgi:hypothetical protein